MGSFLPRRVSGFKSRVINEIIDSMERLAPAQTNGSQMIQTTRETHVKTNNQQMIDEMDEFRMEIVSGTSIKVWKSTQRRNGIDLELTCDAGENFITLTGLSTPSTTYYILLKLSATTANQDHSLKPEKLEAVALTAMPVEDTGHCRYKLIGTVYCDANGVIDRPIPKHLGAVTDKCDIPDGEMIPQKANPVNRSLGYNTDNINEQEIWGFHDAVDTELDATALIPWRKASAALNEILWADMDNIGRWVRKPIADGGGGVDDVIDAKIMERGLTGSFGGVSMPFDYGSMAAGRVNVSGNVINISKSAVSAIDADQNPTATSDVNGWLSQIQVGDIIKVFAPVYPNIFDLGVTYIYTFRRVQSVTDNTSYYSFDTTELTSSGSFTSGELALVSFAKKGDVGATGLKGDSYSNLRLEDGDAIGEKELWVTYTPAVGAPSDVNLGSIYTLPPFPTVNGQYVLEINNGTASWTGV